MLAEHLVAREDSVWFSVLCANCVSEVKTVGGPARSDVVLVLVSIEQLSESLGDGVATRRISEDARSGLTRKEAKLAALFRLNKLFCKEARGNACIKRLLMLY